MIENLSLQAMFYKLKQTNYHEHAKSIFIAILLALLFRSFIVEPYRIPSGSMRPNLLEGDYLFASKFSYGYGRYSFPLAIVPFDGRIFKSEPARGDIIIFQGTKEDRIYIKRLIGLPGDKIQLINKSLYINGKALSREYKDKYEDYTMCTKKATMCEMYNETLPNGVSYTILQADYDENPEFTNTTKVYEVPLGHYFFMGDNRNNSIDSRFLQQEIGYVPEENLIAKAKYLVFTFDLSLLMQGRFFKEIQ